MNKMLLGAGLAVGGYLIYKQFVAPQMGSFSTSPYSNPSASGSASLMTQPSQVYPVSPVVSPRVDNSSQPWYGGSRVFNTSSPDSLFGSDFSGVVSDFKGLSELTSSATSIWNDLGLSSVFSSGGSSFETDGYDDSWMSEFSA